MKRLSMRTGLIPEAIKNHEDFESSHMSGERVDGASLYTSGQLIGDDYKRYIQDGPKIRYIVRSYRTPIAWMLVDGSTYRVAQTFSGTTSRHQSLCYLIGGDEV